MSHNINDQHFEWDDNEPLIGDGLIAGRCDYRNTGCSAQGVVVRGVWICNNHLNKPVAPHSQPEEGKIQ